MRILYVTAHYPPDFVSGATLQVQRLAEQAARAGHEVSVFSGAIAAGLDDGAIADQQLDGVTVRWIGTAGLIEQDDDRNWDNPIARAACEALLGEFAPDVVHAHALQTLGAGVVEAALDRGIRVVLTMHDLWWWCPRLFLVDRQMQPCPLVTDASACACARTSEWRLARARALARTLDRVDEILVPSTVMCDLAIANGVDPARVSVDENDVDVVAQSGRRHHSPHDDVAFVYVGGDHPVKGVDVMLAAAAELRGVGGWRLTTYGVAPRRVPRRLPVTFAPPYEPSRAGDVLAAADVLVIPSIARESFSIAAREALAAGTAVITSDCLGPEEVVRHGENGFIVPTGDAVALAAVMRRLTEDRTLLVALQDNDHDDAPALRSPPAHSSALLARYAATPPPRPSRRPRRAVLIVGGEPAPRIGRLADALELHGTEVAVTDVADDKLADRLESADTVVLHDTAALGPTALVGDHPVRRGLDRFRRAGGIVVLAAGSATLDPDELRLGEVCHGAIVPSDDVAAVVSARLRLPSVVVHDGVTSLELLAAGSAPAARSRRLLAATPTKVAVIVDSPAATDAWRRIEPAIGEALKRRRRVHLDVIAGDPSIESMLGADVVLVPSRTDRGDAPRAWLLASLAGAATVVDTAAARSISAGRTGLVASTLPEWTSQLCQLLDDPAQRAIIAAAARRQVMLHHGPHSTAHHLVAAIEGFRASPSDT